MNVRTIADSEPIIEGECEVGINTELLSRVADYIETHAKEFDMDEWRKNSNDYRPWYTRILAPIDNGVTVGCVACHTVRLGEGNPQGNIPAEAQRLLRLSDAQALRLFYWGNWPEPYKSEYFNDDPRQTDRAWISAQRFRHFITTGGAE